MEKLSFEELNLPEEIQQAIDDMGFEEATPIQSAAIPALFAGHDITGQAQTGTGKTMAFGIPAINMIDTSIKEIQVLVLCPTRELALQVTEEILKVGKYKKGLNIATIYGGQSYDKQYMALRKNPSIVVGTPGRVIDHLQRGKLKLESVGMFILDEADEMLNMGFLEDIETILETIPEERQTVFFSATMPKSILDLTKRYQKNPQFIKVVTKELTVANIEQSYYEIKGAAKFEVLTRLIDINGITSGLVFCNTKHGVDELSSRLQDRGYFAESLHGDMKQAQREHVMKRFRDGVVGFLIATDVAARGIDVNDIEAVFNYDIPYDQEYYVHRIGRTGRAGKLGKAFTFVVGKEIYKLRDIERYAKIKMILKKVPSFEEVEKVRIEKYLDNVKKVIDTDKNSLVKYTRIVEALEKENYSAIDISSALLKMNMGLSEKKYEETNDIEKVRVDPNIKISGDMQRLFISVGRKDNVATKDILGAIAGETGIAGRLIGEINIFDSYSFVDVPAEFAEKAVSIMNRNKIKGKEATFEISDNKDKREAAPKRRVRSEEPYSDSSEEASSNSKTTRLFFNLGSKDELTSSDILEAISSQTGVDKTLFGNVDMFEIFSFVNVPTESAVLIIDKMSGYKVNGRRVNFEISEKKGSKKPKFDRDEDSDSSDRPKREYSRSRSDSSDRPKREYSSSRTSDS
ncbi:MAG: DEAD/DEAH box helicase, partial [Cyanobacteriota bacterium]